MTVVATAGHVDHGKSTLVQALTGVDPDRWAEEKARGLTLDLGFGHLDLPSGRLGLVDVPGHDRYLTNMLAGVGAIDACLFVVAANEGWRAQSEEHLSILEVMGVSRGVVAISMIDLVDETSKASTRRSIADRLAASALAGSDIVEVAAPLGLGVDGLRAALERLVQRTPPAEDRGRPRLWIDRAFTVIGSGTVVTGTLVGGAIHVGDRMGVVPDGGHSRVRSLQAHGAAVAAVAPGHRVAVNLPELVSRSLRRGQALVVPEQWEPTQTVDASLSVLASYGTSLTRRGSYLLHTGTGAWAVGVRVLRDTAVRPGAPGLVRLHLPDTLPLLPGDRFVLRDAGRATTIGGGEVLDVAPMLPPRHATPTRDADRVVREHGCIEVDRLERLTGERRPPTIGHWVISPAALRDLRAGILDAVTASMPLGCDPAVFEGPGRALLGTTLLPEAELSGGRVRLAGASDPLADHPWLAALSSTPFQPPPPLGVPPGEVRLLVQQRLVVQRDGIYFHHQAVDACRTVIELLAQREPEGFTVSQARTALATTRKFTLPLLAELDDRGITKRSGDRRILLDRRRSREQ